jgi:hypothetical protein
VARYVTTAMLGDFNDEPLKESPAMQPLFSGLVFGMGPMTHVDAAHPGPGEIGIHFGTLKEASAPASLLSRARRNFHSAIMKKS